MGVEMVDITEKKEVYREAEAQGFIVLKPETISAIKGGKIPKGDVVTAAQLAAINAVKKTPDLILLAHPICSITSISVKLNVIENGIKATVTVKSVAKTGVELEALIGVTTALLTVFDMCKQFEKDEHGQYPVTKITDVRVTRKVKIDEEGQ
ncbi:cyclic pyranopterin monophosphate synthase MoaC [Candidatus Bathyarchaeota archaeon]|nr:cyclic pyranopterin monophosphate synthase MoaC [Candidatus Bathyarchaeota archaeon]MBS7613600.1 cyclic pyranopterin monophosphate synthase MoaC [Candidatus Bathyarchaeota archaeon]MBS7618410.1 cyclic pyranopterin monophosphate synthase MoaC [Candidatus Bathyarchaeota archaeon]